MNINVFQMESTHQAAHQLSATDKLNLSRKETFTVIARYMNANANTIDDDDFYGFVLPTFTQDTGMKLQDIRDFIGDASDIDVAIFYPFAEQSSLHLNLYEAINEQEPGLNQVMQSYLDVLNLPLKVDAWATNYETTTTTYYVVARPAFWKVWILLSNRLEELAYEQNPLGEALRQPSYEPYLTMKDLIMERLASLVLSLTAQLRIFYASPFAMPASQHLDSDAQDKCIQLNQLKEAYLKSGNEQELEAYFNKRMESIKL